MDFPTQFMYKYLLHIQLMVKETVIAQSSTLHKARFFVWRLLQLDDNQFQQQQHSATAFSNSNISSTIMVIMVIMLGLIINNGPPPPRLPQNQLIQNTNPLQPITPQPTALQPTALVYTVLLAGNSNNTYPNTRPRI